MTRQSLPFAGCPSVLLLLAFDPASKGRSLCRGHAQQTDHCISCNHTGFVLQKAEHVHPSDLQAASCWRAVLTEVLAGSEGHAWDMSGRQPSRLPL